MTYLFGHRITNTIIEKDVMAYIFVNLNLCTQQAYIMVSNVFTEDETVKLIFTHKVPNHIIQLGLQGSILQTYQRHVPC
jgi:hypothetical protein